MAELGEFPVWDLGGGLGVQYTDEQAAPPAIEEYVGTRSCGPRTRGGIRPSSAPADRARPGAGANSGVTLYTVESVTQNVSRWVAVDGGMSDNMRPMLYGAVTRRMSRTASAAAPSACSRASTASRVT